MSYRLFILCIVLLLTRSILLASEIRVNTLGFPGLVNDEEVDIYLNSAVLGRLKTSRVYTGGSLFSADNNAYGNYTQETRAGYLGYIWPLGNTWMGVKYEPSINISNNDHEDYSYKNKESNNYLLIHAGVPVSKKTDFGVSVSHYSSIISEIWKGYYWLNSNEDEHRENDKYHEYQIDMGFLHSTSRHSHTGIVISGISRKWDGWDTSNNEIAITVLPEWSLTKKNLLKSVFKYQVYGHSNSVYNNTTGLAWNYKYSPNFLWVLSAFFAWNNDGHLNGDGFFKAGIEKEIIKKFKARASLTYTTENTPKHIDNLAFGLGYMPIKRINIDLIFRRLQNHYYDHNQEIGIAGSYNFINIVD